MSPDAARFLRFVAAGGAAALVNILSRIWLSRIMTFAAAIVVAYACGMVTAWLLSRLFVFGRSGRHWAREMSRFALVNVLGAAQVLIVSELLSRWLLPGLHVTAHVQLIAHCIGVASPVVASYFGHKWFSFAPATGRRHDVEQAGAGAQSQAPRTAGPLEPLT